MIRAMELFALLQLTGSSGSGIFEMVSAINILVFGVFVAVVMATVLLMGINRKSVEHSEQENNRLPHRQR